MDFFYQKDNGNIVFGVYGELQMQWIGNDQQGYCIMVSHEIKHLFSCIEKHCVLQEVTIGFKRLDIKIQ